jgi:uncharacterized SAM-binding protein YcdF (DUF218 family)
MRRRCGPLAHKTFWRWIGVALLTPGIAILIAWVAAEALIVNSDLAHADALVVLGGSSTYVERTRHAAQLLREGRAPRIILTNDNQISGWSPEEERNPLFVERAVDELTRQGVPREKIEIVPGLVSNTHDEVVRIHEYAREKKLQSILVVTSAYQTRRALWTLRRVFGGSGIEFGLEGVEPGEQSPRRATWWLSRLGWKMVPGEYLKLAYYRLKY